MRRLKLTNRLDAGTVEDLQGLGAGPQTLAALRECGAVYLNAIGGAAQYYSRAIEKVLGVYLMEF